MYRTHSEHNGELKIRLIKNGFVIEYIENHCIVEVFYSTLEELQKFLERYYMKE